MSNGNELFESEALRQLLDGDDPVLQALRGQMSKVLSIHREYTGVGYHATFSMPENAPRLPGNPSFVISDVYAEIEGVEFGAGFALFVADGRLSMLDVSAFGDSDWPDSISKFEIQYVNGKTRDLTALRNNPKWPNYAGAP
jgi:hypothetical protein